MLKEEGALEDFLSQCHKCDTWRKDSKSGSKLHDRNVLEYCSSKICKENSMRRDEVMRALKKYRDLYKKQEDLKKVVNVNLDKKYTDSNLKDIMVTPTPSDKIDSLKKIDGVQAELSSDEIEDVLGSPTKSKKEIKECKDYNNQKSGVMGPSMVRGIGKPFKGSKKSQPYSRKICNEAPAGCKAVDVGKGRNMKVKCINDDTKKRQTQKSNKAEEFARRELKRRENEKNTDDNDWLLSKEDQPKLSPDKDILVSPNKSIIKSQKEIKECKDYNKYIHPRTKNLVKGNMGPIRESNSKYRKNECNKAPAGCKAIVKGTTKFNKVYKCEKDETKSDSQKSNDGNRRVFLGIKKDDKVGGNNNDFDSLINENKPEFLKDTVIDCLINNDTVGLDNCFKRYIKNDSLDTMINLELGSIHPMLLDGLLEKYNFKKVNNKYEDLNSWINNNNLDSLFKNGKNKNMKYYFNRIIERVNNSKDLVNNNYENKNTNYSNIFEALKKSTNMDKDIPNFMSQYLNNKISTINEFEFNNQIQDGGSSIDLFDVLYKNIGNNNNELEYKINRLKKKKRRLITNTNLIKNSIYENVNNNKYNSEDIDLMINYNISDKNILNNLTLNILDDFSNNI